MPDGIWDPAEPNYYDWDISSGNWNKDTKIMRWGFAQTGNYEVWTEVKDDSGEFSQCYAPITIYECYFGETKDCTSPQGCNHTITCQSDGTWPAGCPIDDCIADTLDSIECPCSGIDVCVGDDYYDYPDYGDCNSVCSCDTGISSGQPCAPIIYSDDSRCVGVDQCDSDADCDDGNPCTNNWCEKPDELDSVCRRDNLSSGTYCGVCKICDGDGNCINQPDGENDCGSGCQRCISGSCQDYNLACAGTEENCECQSDVCIDCSDYYDSSGPTCGYQGICYCGSLETPVWSCSEGNCQCICQYDASCEKEGECERDYPDVVFSPSFQEGNPGDTLDYEISVINNDSNCGSSTFSLISGEYCNQSGWNCSALSDLTIDSGQSNLTALSVTSSSGALGGNYPISVTAANKEAGLEIYSRTGYGIYKVFNQPPEKPEIPVDYQPSGVSWNHYSIQGLSIPTFHWTYSDPEGDLQEGYEIWTELFSHIIEGSASAYALSPEEARSLNWNTNYSWKVKVKDDQGNWSEWSDSFQFTTPLHAWPWPDFEPDSQRRSIGEIAEFIDKSKCYSSPGNTEYDCKNGAVIQYKWDFSYDMADEFIPESWVIGDNTTSYNEIGNYKVKLRITDDLGTCTSEAKEVIVTLPLPEWQEIAPF